MGYEFLAWRQTKALTAGQAVARSQEVLCTSDSESLREPLRALNDDSPQQDLWAAEPRIQGGALRLALRDECVEDMAEWLAELCFDHGLLVFDPQQGELFWPTDCMVSKFDLLLDDGSRFAEPSEDEISDRLRNMGWGHFAILTRGEGDYVQVLVNEEDGSLTLECRRGSQEEHYECPLENLGVERAEEVFLAFARGDDGWASLCPWERLSFDSDDGESE